MDLNEKTVVWREDPQPELRPVARLPKDACNFTWLSFSTHAGTHVDAPFYLFSDKWTADAIPFERLIGCCQVIDVSDVTDTITAADLKKHPLKEKMVLLKTRNSFDQLLGYNRNHVAMDVGAAEYLIAQGITTLGYDYQSFERDGANVLHRMFLERSITLIDNLRLKDAEEKTYQLTCLPLKLTGVDGAPARAILTELSYE